MKKIITLIVLSMLLAMPVGAQEKAPAGGEYKLGTPFEGDVSLGYRWNMTRGNPMAGEYEYQHSSGAGSAVIEYDPLPQRFLLETYVNNSKDYFGEFDYTYKDVIMLNMTARSLWHNLDHYSIGQSVPGGMTVTDFNPLDQYGTSNAMNRAQVRFKAPDFPFHVYLEAKNQEKHGTIQQRFMNSFTAGDKMARTRNVDYETEEAKATINSHLSWVEVELSHATKNFKDTGDKSMTDTGGAITYAHNLVPTLESTTDTVKIHTSHTGRIAGALTFSKGDQENKDSGAKSSSTNGAIDFSWIPTKDVTVAVKYRHFAVDSENPDSVTAVGLGGVPTPYLVRNAISYQKDILSGLVRYRATKDLTLRAELSYENLNRDVSKGDVVNEWLLDDKVTRTLVRLGATYSLTKRILLRGDISHMSAAVPADSKDMTYPETSDQARLTISWIPKPWFNMLLSGATVQEKRSDLSTPFADGWEAQRNRLLGSFTVLAGKATTITPSYSFYQNKRTGPVVFTTDTLGSTTAETGVPYADSAHVAALTVSHTMSDALVFTADVSKGWSRGSWQSSGAVPGSGGIADLTNLKLIETVASADLAVRVTNNLGYDLRYKIRRLDDKLDDGQDGTNQIVLATLTYKW